MQKKDLPINLHETPQRIDPGITQHVSAFHQRMSQTVQFYQHAVVFIAAERMANEQNRPFGSGDQTIQPEIPRSQWVRKVIKGLVRQFFPYLYGNKLTKLGEHTRNTIPPSQVVIDVDTSPWIDDRSPEDEADIVEYPLLADLYYSKKGN